MGVIYPLYKYLLVILPRWSSEGLVSKGLEFDSKVGQSVIEVFRSLDLCPVHGNYARPLLHGT